MSDYKTWFKDQEEEFQKEIVKDPKKVRPKFIDENFKPIDLAELKALDEKYIEDQ